MSIFQNHREMMKGSRRDAPMYVSDEKQGVSQPELQHLRGGSPVLDLPRDFVPAVRNNDLLAALESRFSRRQYTDQPLTVTELAFLLWSTQGVRQVIGRNKKATMRSVPSAGARHPFETYLFVKNVEGLSRGLYHYLALTHQLEFLGSVEEMEERLTEAYGGQKFFAEAPVSFVWTVTPYRTEWRYGGQAARYALIDAGHLCENLYLACEAIGCGTCGIGAYCQEDADALLALQEGKTGTDEEEFVVYAAPVGHVE